MAVAGSCGADDLANGLLPALVGNKDFALPAIDFADPDLQLPAAPGSDTEVKQLTNADLTTGQIDGTGTFDILMKSARAHLQREFEQNRITGEQYTKAYIALTEAALGNAVQFLVSRDQSYWAGIAAKLNAQVAQAQVIKARLELELVKGQLQIQRHEASLVEANYGLTKMKIASESVAYCQGKFNLDHMLPEQKKMLQEQLLMTQEQHEAARAQTLNTRRDGTPIVGMLGKQRDLYEQQVTSYKRDAEVKVAKIFSDAWITMKTLDEGLLPPSGFTNANLDQILLGLKANVGLTPAPGEPIA